MPGWLLVFLKLSASSLNKNEISSLDLNFIIK